jgi:hypothetical protein
MPDMDDHACAVNVGNLEMAKLGSTHAGRVKCHQHGAMEEIAGGINEPDRLFLCQDDRQFPGRSRIRHFFDGVVPLQCLAEEETKCGGLCADRSSALFSLVQQMQLVGPDLIRPKLVRWTLKVLRKIRDRPDIAGYGSL